MDRSSGPKCYINYLPLCVIRKSLVRQCFENLENKMSSGRFASLNEAELDQITDSRSSQNTKDATRYAVKTFRSYLLEKQYPEDFENFSKADIDARLRSFYATEKVTCTSELHYFLCVAD